MPAQPAAITGRQARGMQAQVQEAGMLQLGKDTGVLQLGIVTGVLQLGVQAGRAARNWQRQWPQIIAPGSASLFRVFFVLLRVMMACMWRGHGRGVVWAWVSPERHPRQLGSGITCNV